MASKFKTKMEELRLLDMLFETLESEENSVKRTYEIVGHTDVQKIHWKTGELMWEVDENGNKVPKYEDVWDYVDKKHLDEQDMVKLEAIKTIKKKLESFL